MASVTKPHCELWSIVVPVMQLANSALPASLAEYFRMLGFAPRYPGPLLPFGFDAQPFLALRVIDDALDVHATPRS